MDDYFQKCIVCGGLILSLSMPLCKKCLAALPPDLPSQNYPTTTSFSIESISVTGISGTITTTQPPYLS